MKVTLSPILLNIERFVVVFLTSVAFLLALVSFRGNSSHNRYTGLT